MGSLIDKSRCQLPESVLLCLSHTENRDLYDHFNDETVGHFTVTAGTSMDALLSQLGVIAFGLPIVEWQHKRAKALSHEKKNKRKNNNNLLSEKET